MNKIILIGISLVFTGSHAIAQDDADTIMMKKLYSKLSELITLSTPFENNNSLILSNPGILIDDQLDLNKTADVIALNSMIDKIIKPSWIYDPTTVLTNTLYEFVLNGAELAGYQMSAEDAETYKNTLKELYKFNGANVDYDKYTQGYSNFLKYRSLYSKAYDDIENWRIAHPGELVPATLDDFLQNALDDFNLKGRADHYQDILLTRFLLDNKNPRTYWNRLRAIYNNANSTASLGPTAKKYPRNIYYPNYKVWIDSKKTWAKITLDQSDIEKTTINGNTSSSGSGGYSLGLWRSKVSGGNSSDWKNLNEKTNSFKLSFEVLRVSIERPWMDPTVFLSTSWKWPCAEDTLANPFAKNIISNGVTLGSSSVPEGTMPVIITGLLLARNLNISASISKETVDAINTQSSGGGGISFGPFSLGGNKNSAESKNFTKSTANAVGVNFNDPQIIGFFVQSVPMSPNPLSGLKFKECNDTQ